MQTENTIKIRWLALLKPSILRLISGFVTYLRIIQCQNKKLQNAAPRCERQNFLSYSD